MWQASAPDDDVSLAEPVGRRPARAGTPSAPRWSLALFGASVDIHCGGADLAFPHHACEAALAEAATGVTPFARAWLRAGLVSIDGAKMSKSAGNLVLVEDLLREHSPGAIRLLLLNRPWAQPWSWEPGALDDGRGDARAALRRRRAPRHGARRRRRARRAARRPGRARARSPIALEDGGQAARTLIEILALS